MSGNQWQPVANTARWRPSNESIARESRVTSICGAFEHQISRHVRANFNSLLTCVSLKRALKGPHEIPPISTWQAPAKAPTGIAGDEMQGFLFSKPVPGDAFEAAFLGATSEAGA